jgi:hypothetical protein
MLAQAGVGVSLREEDVSAIVVNLGLFQHEAFGFGALLRGRQRGEGRLGPAQQAIGRCNTDRGSTLIAPACGLGDPQLERSKRVLRSPSLAQIVALQDIESKPIALLCRDCASPLRERKRAIVVIIERLRAGCGAIGLRRSGVVCALEMLRMKHQITVRVPIGGSAMEHAPPLMRN